MRIPSHPAGKELTKGNKPPIMHIDNVIFLIMSKNAYTKFSEGPRPVIVMRRQTFNAPLGVKPVMTLLGSEQATTLVVVMTIEPVF